MNRRHFFKHFGGLVAAVAVAQKVVPELLSKLVESRPDTFLFAERFADDIYQVGYRSGSYKSIWLRIVEGGEFTDDMGTTTRCVSSWSAEKS